MAVAEEAPWYHLLIQATYSAEADYVYNCSPTQTAVLNCLQPEESQSVLRSLMSPITYC